MENLDKNQKIEIIKMWWASDDCSITDMFATSHGSDYAQMVKELEYVEDLDLEKNIDLLKEICTQEFMEDFEIESFGEFFEKFKDTQKQITWFFGGEYYQKDVQKKWEREG